jgi:hypothetical protein
MLRPGAVTVDIKNNKVYGDKYMLNRLHDYGYTIYDMAESAIALVEAVPNGVTAVSKDYDGNCYFYAPNKMAKLKIPAPEASPELLAYHKQNPTFSYLTDFKLDWHHKQFAIVGDIPKKKPETYGDPRFSKATIDYFETKRAKATEPELTKPEPQTVTMINSDIVTIRQLSLF